MTLEQVWTLARLWYESRLDPAWTRPTAEQAVAAFASAGLTGALWRL